jgi:hypothetical protein
MADGADGAAAAAAARVEEAAAPPPQPPAADVPVRVSVAGGAGEGDSVVPQKSEAIVPVPAEKPLRAEVSLADRKRMVRDLLDQTFPVRAPFVSLGFTWVPHSHTHTHTHSLLQVWLPLFYAILLLSPPPHTRLRNSASI